MSLSNQACVEFGLSAARCQMPCLLALTEVHANFSSRCCAKLKCCFLADRMDYQVYEITAESHSCDDLQCYCETNEDSALLQS